MMASSSRPLRIVEALDIVERRARLLRAVVAGVVLVGVATTVLAPGLLPPTPLVGALVALAAIIVGVVAAVVVDAGDSTIRGPRHVRSVGGELVGVLPTQVSPAAAQELAGAVLEARGGRRVVLGLTGSGRGEDVPAWSEALATAIAERGASVLLVDVASGATPHDGLLEVVVHGASLGHSVTFERDIKLARLGAGRDLDGAIRAASELPARLPRDLEVLLVALPPVAAGDVLAAAASLDAVLVLARSDATPRVRLGAAVEALEGAGTVAQVVLIDDRAARTPSGQGRATDRPPEGPAPASSPPEPEPEVEPATTSVPPPARAQAAEATPAEVAAEPDAQREPDPPPATEADPTQRAPAPPPGSEPATPGDAGGAEGERAGGAEGERAGRAVPPGTTSRGEIERPPSPSVRLVRDVPAAPAPPDAGSAAPERAPAGEPQRSAAAAPRDPAVHAAAAAARLAAQLNASGSPSSWPGADRDRPARRASEADPVAGEPRDQELVADGTPTGEASPEAASTGEPTAGDGVADEPTAGEVAADEPAAEEVAADEPVEDEVVDPTDELPAIRDERLAAPQAEDDPLRTTAQLALLMDELVQREGDPDRD